MSVFPELRHWVVGFCFCMAIGCETQQSQVSIGSEVPDGPVKILTGSEESPSTFHQAVLRDDDKLVLVDFWATWCPPCQQMIPEVESVKATWKEQLEVVKLDVDDNPELSVHFNVESIPTVLLVRNGRILQRVEGFTTADEFSEIIRSLN
ncbi:MAG: thioredoxin [Planctomycetaceae bacterium]|nr:thioredoxin [Planctomycetaceae bacterium]